MNTWGTTVSAASAAASVPAPGPWLHSRAFDSFFIFGVLAVALAMGGLAFAVPAAFPMVVAADIWLFAYPHVTSTYTRIAFDRATRERYRFLLFGLPPLVLAGTAGVAALSGVAGLFTLYFVWQTWHYTRQSYGITRAYAPRSGASIAHEHWTNAVIYAFPLWGLFNRAAEGHAIFYGAPLLLPHVPLALANGMGVAAGIVFSVWCGGVVWRWTQGQRQAGQTFFVLTHVFITCTSLVWIPEITYGWLFINAWHNAQYLLFVWLRNHQQFLGRPDANGRFLWQLSQTGNAWKYLAFCIAFGAGLYALLGVGGEQLTWSALPMVLVLHMTVNFHHYIVDGVIWRRPRRS